MPDNAPRLLLLAEKEFPDLTEPEREVLRCAAHGKWADLSPWATKKRKTGGGPLRAALVGWLCTDRRAQRLVHRQGVLIENATFPDPLDLEDAHVPFYLGLHACHLEQGLSAYGARFDKDLHLKQCKLEGGVILRTAHIQGQLQCSGARLLNQEGIALLADGMTVGGTVFLDKGFKAMGEVCLLGASIAGQLACRGGSLSNTGGRAINAERITVGGDAFLDKDFQALGEVCLLGANIAGQLDCTGGSFSNTGGDALCAYCATFKDTVRLDPTQVEGAIDLRRASIANELILWGTGLAGCSLLDLSGAKAGVLRDEQQAWPEPGKLRLNGFTYESIGTNAPTTARERLDWLGRMAEGFWPQPYEQLARWLQHAGHESEARTVRIAKEQKRSEFFTNPLESFWWELKHIFVGHGHRSYFTVYWLAGLILLGSWVYAQSIDDMTESVSYNLNATTPAQGHATLQASDYPTLNTLVYSVDVALPIVDLQQERYWMPNAGTENGRALWLFNWFEVLAGWFLASMGIAGATGIIRKD